MSQFTGVKTSHKYLNSLTHVRPKQQKKATKRSTNVLDFATLSEPISSFSVPVKSAGVPKPTKRRLVVKPGFCIKQMIACQEDFS